MMISLSCLECGKSFLSSRKDKKYCSRSCARKHYNYKSVVNLRCPGCDCDFAIEKSSYTRRLKLGRDVIYCSRSCATVHTNENRYEKKILVCAGCKKEFILNASSAKDKYCSNRCYVDHQHDRLAKQLKDNALSGDEQSALQKKRFENKENHPMFGKHHSSETKKILSSARNEYYETHDSFWKDKTLSLDHCAKISSTRSLKWINGDYNNIFAKGKIFSQKMNCEICYSSSWERGYIEHLDKLSNIKSIHKDYIRVSYQDEEGHARNYIVDFLIEYVDGSKKLIEIKPTFYITYEINRLKFAAARAYCAQNNMTFEVLTEIELKALGVL